VSYVNTGFQQQILHYKTEKIIKEFVLGGLQKNILNVII